ncbi:adenosylmethionine decarboxylase [Hugenholtzia roseola]|uniref:adenosylmethionine decarboxylase n=1 Tax=Hugenholtzia roseola TaxID=1002 RepID=UPI000410F77C|nr:adenosylmethionine decarboxylase [Hugenholtzia roseola]
MTQTLGRHLLLELYDCPALLLDDVAQVEAQLRAAANHIGASIVGVMFHHFAPYGVSGVVVIEESHLTIHTWPEWGFASIDIFTCGDSIDPWQAYLFLKEKLGAAHGSAMEMRRGEKRLLNRQDYFPTQNAQIATAPLLQSWLTERDETFALSLKRLSAPLFQAQSHYQKIEIYQTQAYGKALLLDAKLVLTEKDEAAYHEMLVHLPFFQFQFSNFDKHPNPETPLTLQKVLILGGGEGGILRQAIRHQHLQVIDLVEIDEMVGQASRQYLDFLAPAWRDSRVRVHHTNATDFLAHTPPESYDAILIDATDSKRLLPFEKAHYAHIKSLLRKGGFVVMPTHSPYIEPQVLQNQYRNLQDFWDKNELLPYLAHIPTFPSGMCSFIVAGLKRKESLSHMEKKEIQFFSEKEKLFYYNAELHTAAFALPNFVARLL